MVALMPAWLVGPASEPELLAHINALIGRPLFLRSNLGTWPIEHIQAPSARVSRTSCRLTPTGRALTMLPRKR